MTGVFVIRQCSERTAGAIIHRSVWISTMGSGKKYAVAIHEESDAFLMLLPEPSQNKEGI